MNTTQKHEHGNALSGYPWPDGFVVLLESRSSLTSFFVDLNGSLVSFDTDDLSHQFVVTDTNLENSIQRIL